MTFWAPSEGIWSKGFNPKGMPWYASYDYVETYKWNGKGFDLHWRDDFDTFDNSRWLKANGWSYDGNLCTWYASQVGVFNGQLHLKLEPNSWTEETEEEGQIFWQ